MMVTDVYAVIADGLKETSPSEWNKRVGLAVSARFTSKEFEEINLNCKLTFCLPITNRENEREREREREIPMCL